MDRGAWATVHEVAKGLDTTWQLNNKQQELLSYMFLLKVTGQKCSF